jgi:transposase
MPSTQRDFAGLQRRRLQAAGLFAAGRLHLAAIARQLRVSRQSVTRWHAQWKRGGSGALRGAGRAGRKPRLTELDLRRLRNALLRGPRAFGFPIDSWTLPRVAELIHQTNGIRYHPGHVWKILKALDWTPRPGRPAKASTRRGWLAVKRMLREGGGRSGAAGRSSQEGKSGK